MLFTFLKISLKDLKITSVNLMLSKKLLPILLTSLLLSFSLQSHSCTVWGVIKPEEILIAKNRDFYPGNQKFITVDNKGKYKFFGLYGDSQFDNIYRIKMGINEKGLVVFMTFASTIPLSQRKAEIEYYEVMEKILGDYNNVKDVHKNAHDLFLNTTPINYIFADRNNVLKCEIGLENNYQCKIYSRNEKEHRVDFSQTNHYLFKDLQKYNLTPYIDQQSSYMRLEKINSLLKNTDHSINLEKMIELSFNTEANNDSPPASFDEGFDNTYQDNSIFRTFESHPDRKNPKQKNSSRNVSTMIVVLPKDETQLIYMYLRKIESVKNEDDEDYTQLVKYYDSYDSLEVAMNYPTAIKYYHHTCVRKKDSKTCVTEYPKK